jgi:hypothetical protein
MLRERFGIYTDATCPAGRSTFFGGDGIKSCRTSTADSSPVALTCATGTPYAIVTEGRDFKSICVPSSTTTYAGSTTGGPEDWPCRPGDYFGTSADTWTGHVCIPASPSTSTPPPPPSSSSGGDLNSQYKALKTQYDTLITRAITDPTTLQTALPQIQSINQQMATVLDQMLVELQAARNGPNSDAYRDELTATLARIQMDYNGLKTNTDALQTLRRIRSFQDTSWQSTLNLYLALFAIFAIVLVLVMLFRRQTKESTPATIASPPAMPTLM